VTNDNVTEQKWQSNADMLTNWEANEPDMSEPFMGLVSQLLEMGFNQPDNRKNLWASITAALRCLGDNSPVKRGRKSEIPSNIEKAINVICDPIQEALLVLFAVPHYGSVVTQRGGRAFFDNAEDYAEHEAKLIRGHMEDRYRNYNQQEQTINDTTKPSWDGTAGKGGSVSITLGVKADSTEDAE
jgi:hypothetical protein